MVVKVEEAVDIFRNLAQIPTLVSGHVFGGKDGVYKVSSSWNQRDLERSEKLLSHRFDIVREVGDGKVDVLSTAHQYEAANELYNVQSPDGELTVIIRKTKNKKGDEKTYIEIWKGNSKWRNIDAENAEKHGKIYTSDAQFGVVRWSHQSNKLVYIAEKREGKAKSWFEKKPEKDSSSKKDDDVRVGEEYLYKEDWGELLVEKCRPVICILDVNTEEITLLDTSPELSPGTPLWTADDGGVVYAAWNHEPYRIGLVYCPMRKSGIYYHNFVTDTSTKLSGEDVGVVSPVLSPDGNHVLWVEVREGGPHMQTCRLMKAGLSGRAPQCVVGIVDTYTPAEHAQDVFPGWYQIRLSDRCWSGDGRLIVDNPWRFNSELMAVNINDGRVTKLTNESEACTWNVLDVHDDYILASKSSPVQSSHLMLGKLDGAKVTWTSITEGRTFPDLEYKVQVHTIPHNRLNTEFPSVTEFESLLLSPVGLTSANKIPLILHPHGGPHSRFSASFMYFAAGFVQCGFAVLMVNFRASTGYGQDFLWSLPGHVGDMDVKDCMQALTETLSLGVYDADRQCVTGGSHGGLLVGFLIGQYPDTFKVAIARNPVFNMSSMYHATDIADWLHVEVLKKTKEKFDMKYVPTVTDYEKFHQASPLRYVDRVKTPLMLMLGLVDRRVPCAQGQEYYKHLKARGVPTRLHLYPESNHPLQEVNVEADNFVNMVDWFSKYV